MIEFYLSILIRDSLLKDEFILIDNYYNAIKELVNDYKKYDNNKKSLLDSVNDYIDLRRFHILKVLYNNNCVE